MSLKILLAATFATVTGCEASTDELSGTPLGRPSCAAADRVSLGTFRKVADNAFANRFGPCGSLLYRTEPLDLWLLDSHEAPQLISNDVHDAWFGLGAGQIAYRQEAAITLHTLADASERQLSLPMENSRVRIVRSGGEQGLLVCDATGLSWVSPSFDGIAPLAENVSCPSLQVSDNGSAAIVMDGANRTLSWRFGASRASPVEGLLRVDTSMSRPGPNGEQSYANDAFYLSNDGNALIYWVGWFYNCGDTFCGDRATTTLYDLRTNTRVQELDLPIEECCGESGFSVVRNANYLAIGGRSQRLNVIDDEVRVRTFDRGEPKALTDDGKVWSQRSSTLSLRSVSDGAEIFSDTPSHFVVADDGKAAALVHRDTLGARLERWRDNERITLYTTEHNLQVSWIHGVKDFVLAREFTWPDGPDDLVLVGPRGVVFRAPNSRLCGGSRGPHLLQQGLLLCHERQATGGGRRTEELVLIDLDTGAVATVASGLRLSIDISPDQTQVAVRVSHPLPRGGFSEALFAGVLSRPE